jgi:hypothetical protein
MSEASSNMMLSETAFSISNVVSFSISFAVAKPYLATDLADKCNAVACFVSTQCNAFSN